MIDPEVQKMVDDGRLPEDDLLWIGNLPVDKQLSAAKKMVEGSSWSPDIHARGPDKIRRVQSYGFKGRPESG